MHPDQIDSGGVDARKRQGVLFDWNPTAAKKDKQEKQETDKGEEEKQAVQAVRKVGDLPGDVIYTVAKFLKPADVVCLSLANRRLHATIVGLMHGRRLADLVDVPVRHPMSGALLYPEQEGLMGRLRHWMPPGYFVCGQCGRTFVFCSPTYASSALIWCRGCARDRHRDLYYQYFLYRRSLLRRAWLGPVGEVG